MKYFWRIYYIFIKVSNKREMVLKHHRMFGMDTTEEGLQKSLLSPLLKNLSTETIDYILKSTYEKEGRVTKIFKNFKKYILTGSEHD